MPSIVILLLLIVLWVGATAQSSTPNFQVIVNPSNPLQSYERRFVEGAFLKKIKTWPDGQIIHPADLHPDLPARRKFSEQVLKRSVQLVKSYWQQLIFTGRDVPPPELDTDAEMIKHVLKSPSAIGYVSEQADVTSVKVVTVQ